MEYQNLIKIFTELFKYCKTSKQINALNGKIYIALKRSAAQRRSELSIMDVPEELTSFFEEDFDLNEFKSVKDAYEESLV